MAATEQSNTSNTSNVITPIKRRKSKFFGWTEEEKRQYTLARKRKNNAVHYKNNIDNIRAYYRNKYVPVAKKKNAVANVKGQRNEKQ